MQVFVFDPTSSDKASSFRGVGRYLQILKENCSDFCTFVSDLSTVPYESILINPFLNFVGGPVLSRRIAKIQVGVIHDLIPLQYPEHFPVGLRGKITIWKNKRLLSLYDHFITVSETSKTNIINILHVQPEKISVVYSTLVSDFWREEKLPKPENAPETYSIYVGDATWNKNIVNMAGAVIKSKIPCVCIGKVFLNIKNFAEMKQSPHPWQEELWKFSQLTVHNNLFIFPGYVSDLTLRAYYQHALVNILVSHDEGFGFSYLEASSQYCPSIISDTKIGNEISSGAAYIVRENDVNQIAKAIKEAHINKEMRQIKIQASHQRSSFFSPSQFAQNITNTINALAK